MDCALKIRQKYSPEPKEIAEIVCRTAEGPVHRLWEPLADKQKPVSSYGAKFSLPYSIAVMIVRGRAGLDEFTEEAIRDSAVLDLARKVRYELDPTIDYPRHFSGPRQGVDERRQRCSKRTSPIRAAASKTLCRPRRSKKNFAPTPGLRCRMEKVEALSARSSGWSNCRR